MIEISFNANYSANWIRATKKATSGIANLSFNANYSANWIRDDDRHGKDWLFSVSMLITVQIG